MASSPKEKFSVQRHIPSRLWLAFAASRYVSNVKVLTIMTKQPYFVALISGLISILLVVAYVKMRRYELTRGFGEEVRVVVSNQNIEEYGMIREDMLSVITVFKKFKQPQTASDIDEIVGKSTFVPIYKGEQIPLTKLITQDGKPLLDRALEPTMRAITLPISSYTGVAKLIKPGNYVDILSCVHYDDENGNTMFEVKTVVQNVLVLATGKYTQNSIPSRVNREVYDYVQEQANQRNRKDFSNNSSNLFLNRPDDNYQSLTLQLNPRDAEKVLYLANRYGDNKLYFTLRNGADHKEEFLQTALLEDVLGPDSDYGALKQKPKEPPPPPPPRFYDNRGGVPSPVY